MHSRTRTPSPVSNDYVLLPLWLEDRFIRARSQQRFSVPKILAAAVVIFSILLNIVFIVGLGIPNLGPLRPFDDFQHLNDSALFDGPVEANSSNAIVTTLYNDAYAPAVATLGHSVKKAHSSAKMIVLYFPTEVSQQALCIATSSGFVPHPVSRIPPPKNSGGMLPHFVDQFTKLTLWTLDSLGLSSLVYLDADTLVVRNFDEIFSLPYLFAAAPDVWAGKTGFTLEFNAGVLFIRPNSTVFHHMLEVLPSARFPPQYAEQGFLNQYFAAESTRLPIVYNANLQAKTRFPALWKGIQDNLRIIHYTLAKPFVGRNFAQIPLDQIGARVQELARKSSDFKEEILLWGAMWDETRRTYTRAMDECSSI